MSATSTLPPLSPKQRLGLEVWRGLRHNAAALHQLRTLFWECTLRCNMACRHCGSDCKASSAVPDMPADDFLRVIDGLTPHVDPHRTFIIFTGGEALLRNDLEHVGLELYRREYPWGLVTNGLLLTAERLDSLLASGMHSITVSLDGLDDSHNWLRRNPQSFAAVMRAVELLTATPDLLWVVVTCLNPRNYSQLPALRDELVACGVRRWRIFTIFPMGRAAGDAELQLSAEQLRGTLDFIAQTRAEGRMVVNYACEGFLGSSEGQVRDTLFQCRAGVEVASDLCDGSISGCTSIRSTMHQGNIYQDDLWEVWNSRFEPYRDRSWTRKEACADCRMWRYCEGNGMHLYDDDGHLLHCHYLDMK